jgi:predicted flap endonuclease-1-like 5' DNA nuclease
MSVNDHAQRVGAPASKASKPASDPAADPDKEGFHELRDDEFTLEADEASGVEPIGGVGPTAKAPVPPLPPWAAASRSLLENLQRALDDTIELPAAATLSSSAEKSPSEPSARDRLKRLAQQIRAREIYVQEVERALHVATGRVRGQAFRIAELEIELRDTRARDLPVSEAPRTTATRRRTTRPAAKPKPSADDLLEINGIGPRTAEQLKKLRITFEMMAKWTPADVTRIAKTLATSPDRIQREGWIKQARALHKARDKRKHS